MINIALHSLLAHDLIICTEPSRVEHTVICTSVGMEGIKTRGKGGESFIKKKAVCHTTEQQTLADTNIATSPVLNKYTFANT